MHRTSDTKFDQIHSHKGIQAIYAKPEEDIRSSKPESDYYGVADQVF